MAAHYAVFLGALASLACEPQAASAPPQAAQPARAEQPAPGDTARRVAEGDSALRYPIVPKAALTPGATLVVTAADICVPGYTKKVRNVPAAVKRQVYASYGVRTHQPGDYEIDHLISLELGGSNSTRNLWPESYRTHPWNARVKDALENELHRRVCAGTMDLARAQAVIAKNWVIGYREFVRPAPPAPVPPKTPTRKSTPDRPAPAVP
jgi:hypothetical protein